MDFNEQWRGRLTPIRCLLDGLPNTRPPTQKFEFPPLVHALATERFRQGPKPIKNFRPK